LGILHGANDIRILSQPNKETNVLQLVLFYLAAVLGGAMAFFFFPTIALLIFILFSAYHFGEQHWAFRLPNTLSSAPFYFVYGSLIFSLIFYFHIETVTEVVQTITFYKLPFILFERLVLGSAILFIGMALFSVVGRKHLLFEFLLLLMMCLVIANSSLIMAFAFYFVIWHSFPSLKSQFGFLYANTNRMQQFRSYVKESFFYWVAALLGLLATYLWVDFSANYFLPLFFTFLAAITFPHVLVMHWMFRHKKRDGIS
jgi:Brp/Blh family beta-carotene 15,15'-monooxygenase